ncbi:unnamed protein product [Ambrosiozyma monospora]|uniref:Unnamed protein product n=1 Tax=Ambrosiozyma monospora TaxID=43982 RepID=A0A9W7DFX4_AMBMO|nr:unnamed protein product [Ambrosiozyma monospora]
MTSQFLSILFLSLLTLLSTQFVLTAPISEEDQKIQSTTISFKDSTLESNLVLKRRGWGGNWSSWGNWRNWGSNGSSSTSSVSNYQATKTTTAASYGSTSTSGSSSTKSGSSGSSDSSGSSSSSGYYEDTYQDSSTSGSTNKKFRDDSASDPSGTFTGKATYYSPGKGNCQLTSTDSDYITAISRTIYAQKLIGNEDLSSYCGDKITVTYNGKSVTVTAVDVGGAGGTYDLDLSPSAFAQLAPLQSGILDGIEWHWGSS